MVGRKQGARGLFLGLALAVVSLAASPSISRAEPQDTISRTAQNLAPAVISPGQPSVASQPAVQPAVLAPEAGSATAASGLPPEQVEAIMRTQSCLAQLGFYQGEIDGKRGSETWTAYWHFKKQHGLKAHSDFLAKPVQTKLAALCKEKPKKAVAALDPAKQPSLLPEAAVVPEAPASTGEETPSAAPARLEMGCLPDDLRALLPPSRAAAARRCSGACMPPPKGFSQSLLDELQARSGVVWCRSCLAIDGRLTLADVQNIERGGNIELCATPPRQVPRHMSGAADTSYTRIREFYRSLPPVPEDEETVAVVIGNRNYAKLPPSETSANDAGAVYAILTEYLGVRQDNVIDLRDARQADFNAVFGSLGVEGELARIVRARSGARVIVYYSGHGATDSESGETYLLPVESEPFREALTGYRLSTLYTNLAALGARSALLVLEAEFGRDRSATILPPNLPDMAATALPPAALSGVTVLAASDRGQRTLIDTTYDVGLFTRYLVEALAGHADLPPSGNDDGTLDSAEIYIYSAAMVRLAARKTLGLLQNPVYSSAASPVVARIAPDRGKAEDLAPPPTVTQVTEPDGTVPAPPF